MTPPPELRYHPEHLWARPEGERVRVGVTDYAQEQLGQVVYVDLPAVGATVTAGEPFGEVESTKTVSDLHAPVGGTVLERNDRLDGEPDLVNTDPYGEGWLLVIDPGDDDGVETLLDAEAYDDLTAGG